MIINMIIKTNYFLLLLYLSINIMSASENKDLALFNQRLNEYKQIKEWAKSKVLLEDIDYKTTLNFNEKNISISSNDAIKNVSLEKSIKDIISLVIFNFKKYLKNKVEFDLVEKEGYFYFLNKKIKIILDTTEKSLKSASISDILHDFTLLKTVIENFNYFLKNKDNPPTTIKGIEKITLDDYYNSLLMKLRQDQQIIQPVFRYAILPSQNSVEKKWVALIIHIKNNLLYTLKSLANKNAKTINKSTHLIIGNIQKIDTTINQYNSTYLNIKEIYEQYQNLLNIIKNRVTRLPDLFTNFITWAEQNNLVLPNQNQKYANENIKNLTYDIRSLMIQKYEDLKNNYMGAITFNDALSKYNMLSHEIRNIEPKEKYEFEDAYNTIVNAYDFYEKITKKAYIQWAAEQGIFSKEKIQNNTLAEIIVYIQNALIKKIELLSIKYVDYPPLPLLKNALPNQTTLSALSKTYTEYENEKVKIKNLYINWAINNGLIIKNEVKNTNLEAVVTLIQQELLKRINQLPKTQVNQQKIQSLQKEFLKATNLSELSAKYKEYLTIKKNTPVQPISTDQENLKPPAAQTVPLTKPSSWQGWFRSWLPWSSRK
jgi:hypothetical protein